MITGEKDFKALNSRIDGLLLNLAPANRKRLMRKLAQVLVSDNRKRITAQQNADGSAYAPRKMPKIRQKFQRRKGAIKRGKMFTKLKTARFLKQKVSDTGLEVGFQGRTAKLATAHQTGGTERHGSHIYRLPKRDVLAVNKETIREIEREILELLGRG